MGSAFVVGVAGGTASGKTTVAERLAELLGDDHLALLRRQTLQRGDGAVAALRRDIVRTRHSVASSLRASVNQGTTPFTRAQ